MDRSIGLARCVTVVCWMMLCAFLSRIRGANGNDAEQAVRVPTLPVPVRTIGVSDFGTTAFSESNASSTQLPISVVDVGPNKWNFTETLFGTAIICSGLGLLLAALIFSLAHFLSSDIGESLESKLKTAVDICTKRNLQEAQLCRAAVAYVLGGPTGGSVAQVLDAGAVTKQQNYSALPEKHAPPPISAANFGAKQLQLPTPLSAIPPFSGGSKSSSFILPPTNTAVPSVPSAVDTGELRRLKERCAELERQSDHYKETVNKLLRTSDEREVQLTDLKRTEQMKDDELRDMERRYAGECDRASSAILELEDVRQRLSDKEAENKGLMENLSTFRTSKDDFMRLDEDTVVQALREHTSKNLDELRQMLDKTAADLKQSQSESFALQNEKLHLTDRIMKLEAELAETSSNKSVTDNSDEMEQQVLQLSTDLRIAQLDKERLEREATTLKDRLSAVQKQFELAKLLQFSESRLHEVEKFKIELRESLLDEVRVNHEREVDQYKYTSEALKDELRDKNRAYQDSTRALRMQCERRDIDLMNCQNLIEDLRAKIQSLQADNKALRAASGKPDYADDSSSGRNDANVPVVFGGPHAHTFDMFHNSSKISGGGFDLPMTGTGSPGSAFSSDPQSQMFQMAPGGPYGTIPAPPPPMYGQQFSFTGQPGLYGGAGGYLSSPAGSAADEFRSKRSSKHHTQPQQQSRRRHTEEPAEGHEKRTPEHRSSKRSTRQLRDNDNKVGAGAETGFAEEDESYAVSTTERDDRSDGAGSASKAVRSKPAAKDAADFQQQSSLKQRRVTTKHAENEQQLRSGGGARDTGGNASDAAASSKSGFGIRPLRR